MHHLHAHRKGNQLKSSDDLIPSRSTAEWAHAIYYMSKILLRHLTNSKYYQNQSMALVTLQKALSFIKIKFIAVAQYWLSIGYFGKSLIFNC